MTVYFADTSAIVKRYVPEIGSAWVTSWAHAKSPDTVVISRLATVEFVSALARRQRELSISANDFTRLRGAFLGHADKSYVAINLTKDVLADARDLLARHPLRTLDVIQLASAVKARSKLNIAVSFISADARLLAAASAEGFAVDDPNAHP